MIDKKLLEILACPSCKAPVVEEDSWILCANGACGLKYPVRDGIPVMLVEEAQKPSRDSQSFRQGV